MVQKLFDCSWEIHFPERHKSSLLGPQNNTQYDKALK